MKIKNIKAREILDSRGYPTIEVSLETEDGVFVDSVPSGASVGEREALELRDNDENRYFGKGVLNAISNIENIIQNELKEKNITSQKELDDILISLNKDKLGANAVMAVSLASARALANKQPLYNYIANISSSEISIPSPCFNVINGGTHAKNDLAFQEFMINFKGHNLKEQIRMGAETYHTINELLGGANVGDEGGFGDGINSEEQALDLIVSATKKLGYFSDLNIFLDVAASEFYNGNSYILSKGNVLSKEELVEYYKKLCKAYPIKSIEDPFDENDFAGFKMLNQAMLGELLIIGDDLTVTNIKSIKKAYDNDSINGLLVKINQIGTVSEAIEAVNLARSYNYKIMVSHRSGETTDDFIADFAVGLGADFIKAGAPARGERVSKYNRLLKIKEEL